MLRGVIKSIIIINTKEVNVSFIVLKDMCSVGMAWDQIIDMNTLRDGHFCSVPFVVLKILWRKFYGVDWNCPAQHT
jgi:hypothetical protein